MPDSKTQFSKSLGRYVQILHEQGVGHVALDKKARETLRRVAATTKASKDSKASKETAKVPPKEIAIESAMPKPVVPPRATAPASPVPIITVSEASSMASEKIEGADKREKLANLAARAAVCLKCSHLAAFRNTVVFGEGNPDAALMFVGEAPGADEDEQGRPFIGRAGQTLTKMIQAMGLTREELYIGNILKCRPDMPQGASGNRKPTSEEMKTCMPWILAQIDIIQPKVLVALGTTSVEALLDTKLPISRIRGKFVDFRGIPLMPTFHPSYLLHNPTNETKRKVWEDLLQVMEKLQMPISAKQRGFFLGA